MFSRTKPGASFYNLSIFYCIHGVFEYFTRLFVRNFD
nr:MAG TPA: hypothetical protein [Caudoviricetes sp.]